MNKESLVWLHLSIFYPKLQWNEVLYECVCPFFKDKKKLDSLDIFSYLLLFNYQRGENIQISIAIKEERFTKTIDWIDNYFKDYLVKKPIISTDKFKNTMVNEIFMPYPINSVQYNLHSSERICKWKEMNEIILKCSMRFSELLIDMGCKKELETEEFTSFSLYLYILCLRGLNNSNRDYQLMFQDFLTEFKSIETNNFIIDEISHEEKGTINDALKNNIELLLNPEIKPSDFDETWIKDWLSIIDCLYGDFCTYNNLYNNKIPCSFLYRMILEMINRHLGVKEKTYAHLLLIIEKIIIAN